MGVEIERKFLLKPGVWPVPVSNKGLAIVQGYLSDDEKKVIRVRTYGEQGFLTIKSRVTGILRQEFEFEIPVEEAKEILSSFCEVKIEKVRYELDFGGKKWEIDVFSGDNSGLIVVEVELESVTEEFVKPEWLGEEVSHDKRYFNSNLSFHPFKDWSDR